MRSYECDTSSRCNTVRFFICAHQVLLESGEFRCNIFEPICILPAKAWVFFRSFAEGYRKLAAEAPIQPDNGEVIFR